MQQLKAIRNNIREMNKEIEEEMKGAIVANLIKIRRIKWLGYIWREQKGNKRRDIIEEQQGQKEKRGRHRVRCKYWKL